ncbi:MAG TPA: Ig-like domain repeat protein [Nakamurella sp.]|nr:Ig-like domain repeat protein [Nakamurella sp.]
MSGKGWRRALTALGAALTLAAVSACGPSERALDATRDQVTSQQQAAKAAAQLTVTPAATTVSYGAPLDVAFSLTAAGAPLADTQVSVAVGGQPVSATTDAKGSGSVTLKAGSLPAGSQTVTVSYPGSDQALAASSTATITVAPAAATATLTVTAKDGGGSSALVQLATPTGVAVAGTASLDVDGTVLGAQTVAGGQAAFDVPATLGVGDHTVTAQFTSDNPAQVSNTSATSTISVAKASTSVSAGTEKAGAEKDVIRYGDQGSFEITVTGPAGADLSGGVAVLDGSTVVAEGSTDATGKAALSFSNTADPGPKNYTVAFAGSASVEASQAAFTVQTTQTNVDIAINEPSGVQPGQDATISVSVIGTPQKPTGTATVSVDGNQVANGPLVDGAISAVASAVAAGDHSIQVEYSGDVRFQPNTAGSTLTVKEPVANPNAGGAAAVQASNPCPGSASACIDLSNEQAWLQTGGQVTYGPVSITSGRAGYRTGTGMFSVFWRDRDHKSSIFGDAPMPNSVFFNDGIAFHAGSLSAQSHGCIHLSYDASEVFFDTLSVGNGVYVWGAAPY